MKLTVASLLSIVLMFLSQQLRGQTVNPYHMNGSAIQENCNCYTLTPDETQKSGSVWNVNKIDLRKSFDYKFDVFLGCEDQTGADGIVFVLQPIDISIGSAGGGLGVEGVRPSIAVAIDTWQNTIDHDPYEDHIAIHRNGNIDHYSSDNLAGPVSVSPDYSNIEDCKMHSFRIIWDASAKKIKAQIDGVDRVEATVDMVADIFNNDPMVFWGFTGSTGGSKNLQRFCTALNAAFTVPKDLKTCFPVTIPFTDSSSSFGDIVKWNWDFGDGTTSSSSAPPPHVYATPGNYDIRLNIAANNGCTSDTFKQRIVVGSKPVADFVVDPGVVCDSVPVFFNDLSTVAFGTINKWEWTINGNTYTQQSPGPLIFPSVGTGDARITVSTKEGCVSEPVTRTFNVLKRPEIDYTFNDVCKGDPVLFNGSVTDPGAGIRDWTWTFGDGLLAKAGNSISHNYRSGGAYLNTVYATSVNGCKSFTLSDTVQVYETNANAGADTILAIGQPYQLKGSGGEFYSWSPAIGLSDAGIANPVATLQQDQTFTLTTTTAFGCPTTDIVNIKVYAGPQIYVPNAFTPNNDGKNDRFRPVAVGMTEILYFQVYNRYGQLLYASTDTFIGWDGTLAGKAQPSGTYVWKVAGIDFNGKEHVKSGTITLLR